MLNACVNANLSMDEDEEVLDLCQAMEVLQERAANNAHVNDLKNLMETMNLTSEKAMDALRIPEQERKELRHLL